jgi:hypothetical protein
MSNLILRTIFSHDVSLVFMTIVKSQSNHPGLMAFSLVVDTNLPGQNSASNPGGYNARSREAGFMNVLVYDLSLVRLNT